MRDKNPFSNFVMVDGFIIDKGSLPPEIQKFLVGKEKPQRE